MHAVQSALAIRRERERRQSLNSKNSKGKKGQQANYGASQKRRSSLQSTGIPEGFRATPDEGNNSCTYPTVGSAFIILGILMIIPVFATQDALGLDWHHLLGIGSLLIFVGFIMIAVTILTNEKVEAAIERYMSSAGGRLGRSNSQNPIIEDAEYGVDSRRSSLTMNSRPASSRPQQPATPEIPKDFEQAASSANRVAI